MLFLKRFLTAIALFFLISPSLLHFSAAVSGGLHKVPGNPVPQISLLSLDAERTVWQQYAPLFMVATFGLSVFGAGLLSFSNVLPWCREVIGPSPLPGTPAYSMERTSPGDMSPDKARFLVGTPVRISDASLLARFRQESGLHHPLTAEQLLFAGHRTEITRVGMHQITGVIYELRDTPGIWPEACLCDLSPNKALERTDSTE